MFILSANMEQNISTFKLLLQFFFFFFFLHFIIFIVSLYPAYFYINVCANVFLTFYCYGNPFFMPPTLQKLKGHIAFGLSAHPSVHL